jgi:mRNA-degrading endonuclease RelE of RelBE toxin-antitoxin system
LKKKTEQNTSKSKTRYKIVLTSSRIKKDWEALEQEFPERMKACKEFLRANPEDRTKAVGILKKLKGPYKEYLQYDITKDDSRVWYRVDKKNLEVLIKYAGHHPD